MKNEKSKKSTKVQRGEQRGEQKEIDKWFDNREKEHKKTNRMWIIVNQILNPFFKEIVLGCNFFEKFSEILKHNVNTAEDIAKAKRENEDWHRINKYPMLPSYTAPPQPYDYYVNYAKECKIDGDNINMSWLSFDMLGGFVSYHTNYDGMGVSAHKIFRIEEKND